MCFYNHLGKVDILMFYANFWYDMHMFFEGNAHKKPIISNLTTQNLIFDYEFRR